MRLPRRTVDLCGRDVWVVWDDCHAIILLVGVGWGVAGCGVVGRRARIAPRRTIAPCTNAP
eukprot:10068406-Prorocentrum_lima.AAC.1